MCVCFGEFKVSECVISQMQRVGWVFAVVVVGALEENDELIKRR